MDARYVTVDVIDHDVTNTVPADDVLAVLQRIFTVLIINDRVSAAVVRQLEVVFGQPHVGALIRAKIDIYRFTFGQARILARLVRVLGEDH